LSIPIGTFAPGLHLENRIELMLRGRHFKISSPTLAVLHREGKQQALTVPEGAIIFVIADNQTGPNALVGVLYDGELIQMFAEDVRARGDDVTIDMRRDKVG
jgi:hypothetical protein